MTQGQDTAPAVALPGDPEFNAALERAISIAVRGGLETLAADIHTLNGRWWVDLETGARLERNVGEMLMLAVSELSEAMEGHRKGKHDDHLPHRPMIEVEIADCMIRLLDLGAGLGLDVAGALVEKLAYNARRADHTLEARRAAGGKRY